jgi:hypothetical protein
MVALVAANKALIVSNGAANLKNRNKSHKRGKRKRFHQHGYV